ncbi:hypothetical protein NSPZN2_130054 [Nitrospira defluvii]|uniref:Uncharacterized protein n=1 Tax=Nitrospira defluvii TaxID=330214 RepID=A0ABM8R966_9BACT|nr:hypothetical protein NSPZN2_130054 [Nitrospira defluvii]
MHHARVSAHCVILLFLPATSLSKKLDVRDNLFIPSVDQFVLLKNFLLAQTAP